MSNNKKGKEIQERKKPMSFIALVIWTGLVGGLAFSLIGYGAYLFHLTELRPNFILEPWALGSWKRGGLGTAISIVIIGCISIVVAFVYYVLLRKFPKMWIGMGYGLGLFVVVFVLLNPIFPSMSPFMELKRDTIITSVCLYILYGVFIGYTISYEEVEVQLRKMKEKQKSASISSSEGSS